MKNQGTLLEGIHLDQEFKEARERKKPPIKPYPKHLKQALEKSIVTVVNRNDGSMECGGNDTTATETAQISNISLKTVHTKQNEK